jgi:hypothetical protein
MARRRRWFELCLLVGGCVLAALIAWSIPASGDYWPGGLVLGDSNAAPAIEALAHGHLGAYAVNQPLMGLVSLLVRVPAVLVAEARPGHPLLEYRLGVVLCLTSVPLLAIWLSRLAPGRQWKAICALLCVLLIAGSNRIDAIRAGHPEEILTAVLGVAAVIAAQRQRPLWAGLMLGLAIGTKPWAVLAALPVFTVLEHGRWRAFAVTASVSALALIAAMVDPSAFLARARGIGGMHLVNPYSLWWQLGSNVPGSLLPARMLPPGLTRTSGLVLATGALSAAVIAYGLARDKLRPAHPLALLAALWLMRALADPHPNDYYYVPFLVAVAVWEVYSLRRVPLLAVLGGALLRVTYELPFYRPGWPNTFLLVWTLVFGTYLAGRAFGHRGGRPASVHLTGRYFNWLIRPVDLSIEDA